MNRRDLLLASLSASAVALAGRASGQTELARFARAFRSVPDGGIPRKPLRLIAGQSPGDLVGTYFLNGPAKHERGGERNEHWFDGDGMLNAFRFGDGAATHEARYVETQKFKREREAGKRLFPSFDHVPRASLGVSASDDGNAANISVIERGSELWALWEGGSPHRIDPADLSTKGPVVLAEGFAGVPFSAHPRQDRNGTLWAYGFSAFAGRLILSEIAPDGTLRRFKVLDGFPNSMVHDFVSTEKHLVIGFPPYTISREGGAYLDHFLWHGEEPRLYVVIEKESFEIVRRYELPARFQFHHFAAYEETDGTIRFASCSMRDASWVETEARAVMEGQPFTGEREAIFERITLRPNGRVEAELSDEEAEFPVGDPRLAETAHTQFCIGRTASSGRLSNAIFARAPSGEALSSWSADNETLMGEHIVVPRTDGESYLIGTQFDARRGRTLLSLFASDNLAAGPRAIWETSEPIPVPLHGTWVQGSG
ncbi:MAG: carotenoid oxygenase family protein [Parvularcula sp.]|jgi:carotenoid cleavage dioxygenase|nr:carotenoid oxygenase family protein [Parvularcula sp.]